MDFAILGPLEVLDGDQALPLRGPRQRGLLALLLLHANEVVSTDRLIDDLWAGEASDSAGAALQASVSRLRKALGAGAECVVTAPPGYAIRIAAGELDLDRFERLVAEADGAEPSEAAATLRRALALWRGSPLGEFAYERWAQTAIARLEELRLLALDRRIEADLELGRHSELVPELEALVTEHPLRESLRGQLMVALYRSGRQSDALARYQAGRRVLVDELGIEPGTALQALEQAILRQDEALDLTHVEAPRRSILVAAFDGTSAEPLLALAEPLARSPSREIIVSRLLVDPARLAEASAEVQRLCEAVEAQGGVGRAATFTSASPGADASRLATEQDVDLVLVSAPPALLDDSELASLLRTAPCDVAVVVGDPARPGPVLVPFAGAEHDWSAIELGAWLAGAWGSQLRLAGPATEGGRDSSRLLASASLAVQRALGVAAQPLLVEAGPDALVAAARDAAVAVVGLSDRWQREGLGATRAALAAGDQPVLLVRKGLRPGGLASPENLTRFTWSLRVG